VLWCAQVQSWEGCVESHDVIRGTAAEANASQTDGWVVGHFMPPGLGQRKDVEVKLWHYDVQPHYPVKVFGGTEFIVIYRGQIRIDIVLPDGKEESCVLNGDRQDFVIFPPGTKKKVTTEAVPAFGVTVRWPSAPELNQVIEA